MSKSRFNRGFTLVELIIVIAIIAVLSAVVAPQYVRYVASARESTCLANRTALERFLAVEQLYGEYASLSAAAAEGDGAAALAACTCPAGGNISITAEGVIQCDEHSTAPVLSGAALVEDLFERMNTKSDYGGWKAAVKEYLTLTGNGDSFPPVESSLLDAYKAKMRQLGYSFTLSDSTTDKLTWKPAVTSDGSVILIASVSENTSGSQSDANAIRNSGSTTSSGGYVASAYLVFDGTNYYAHHNGTSTDNNYVGDQNVNFDAIIADSQWVNLGSLS